MSWRKRNYKLVATSAVIAILFTALIISIIKYLSDMADGQHRDQKLIRAYS